MRTFILTIPLVAALVGCGTSNPQSTSTGGTSAGGPSSGGGTGSGASSSGSGGGAGTTSGGTTGGPQCVTAADCVTAGQACLDGGVCGAPTVAPSLVCVAVGQNCTPSGPPCCQGACGDDGFCTSWTPCALIGEQCGASDCCADARCDAGICHAACGGQSTACNADSDCCGALGLVCRPPSVPTGNPKECISEKSATSCTPQASPGGLQCNLGTACAFPSEGGADPCQPAGYVCDTYYGVCRKPEEFERCVAGGPPCSGIPNSAVAGLQCINLPGKGYPECLQPCLESSDCIGVSQSCATIAEVTGDACFGNYGCTDYFDACNAAGFSDGTCVPIQTSTGIRGECWQSVPDAGATCDRAGNRENGGLCAVGQRCIAGLCKELCNAGTFGGGPSCGADSCIAAGLTSDPTDEGICEAGCDFLGSDSGGCPSSPESPEKCIPSFVDGLSDQAAGICAAAVSNPPALGQHCTPDPLHVDACGPGQVCTSLHGGSQIICTQLCPDPGSKSTCPGNLSCQTWRSSSAVSTYFGYCG